MKKSITLRSEFTSIQSDQTTRKSDNMLLAGDIGGTKTVLALISEELGVRNPVRIAAFPSASYQSFEAVIADFLADIDIDLVTSASFGVAGPVLDGKVKVTNLPWTVDAEGISRSVDIKHVFLLNDLESIASSIPHLQPEDLATINVGDLEDGGAIAVIAPGTGLGEAFLTWNGGRYQAHPSEGGHASFAPTTAEQQDLLTYLRRRYGHVSYERVCSGSGIPNIYQFLRETGRYPEPSWLASKLAEANDPTPIIAEAAAGNRAEICSATMKLFVEILANEASNMAMKVLATGGIYLGGGIPPRILPRLHDPLFMQIFTAKGRFAELLNSFPIHVIRNPEAALYGAAYYGLDMR